MLDGVGRPPSVDFQPGASIQTTDGPYVRIALPQIDIPIASYAGPNILDPADIYSPLGRINNAQLFAPSLKVWVDTTPFEQLDSYLESVHIVPTPSQEIPLEWQGDRFVGADLLYRDTQWDHTASLKIFFGGLATGIGVTLATGPIALLAGDPKIKRDLLQSALIKRRAKMRKS